MFTTIIAILAAALGFFFGRAQRQFEEAMEQPVATPVTEPVAEAPVPAAKKVRLEIKVAQPEVITAAPKAKAAKKTKTKKSK